MKLTPRVLRIISVAPLSQERNKANRGWGQGRVLLRFIKIGLKSSRGSIGAVKILVLQFKRPYFDLLRTSMHKGLFCQTQCYFLPLSQKVFVLLQEHQEAIS